MNHFCTIASGDYLPFVETLFLSLKRQTKDVSLHALITDDNFKNPEIEGLSIYSLYDLSGQDFVAEIIHKYKSNNNYVRWALKPVFLHYLVQKHETIVYVDNDICFFAPFEFLFQQLSSHSILLTPHWFSQKPFPHPENFETNFQIGLFNAGFLGASQHGSGFLKWWAEVCLYKMERNEKEGFYDDQRFLDMSWLVDEGTGIVRHRGCNVGSWNMHQNKRKKVGNEVRINGEFPVVFIHFNHETIKHILNGNDGQLQPYFDEYGQLFSSTGHRLENFIPLLEDWKPQSFTGLIFRKAKLRTRLKRLLFYLSEKL